MGRLHLLEDLPEIVRRRKLVPPGQVVEVWQDLYAPGDVWVGEETKAQLDAVGPPLAPKRSLPDEAVRIYYGPRLRDLGSLPREESLRARVVSAHGIAVAWITLDQFGARAGYEPRGPEDPVFFLRRPGGGAAHLWRLFRTRGEAVAYMTEYYGKDPEAEGWARGLPVADYAALLARPAD